MTSSVAFRAAPLIAWLSLAGCSAGNTGAGMDAGVRPPVDAGNRGVDAGRPMLDAGAPRIDAGRRVDAGTPTGDAGAMTPDGGAITSEVRFIVMGDTGEGNDAQREVASRIVTTCAAEGCDFVILLGDNFYDSGVTSVDDSQWQTKFEQPYAAIELPFYAVLGNHDYGGSLFGADYGGLGNEFDRGPIEVAYTARSTKWTMPDTFYTFRFGHVGFVMIDTNSILWNNTDNGDQRAWFRDAVAQLRAEGATRIVLAGHHTYRSNGRHGNAGSYESIVVGGVDIPNPLPILNGGSVRDFFDDYVCGEVDVYFAGHDHNRQWLNEPGALCGAELIVSGAGAKTTDFETMANAWHWGDDSTEGFFYVRIRGDEMYGRSVNRDGTTAFEQTVTLGP